MAKLNYMVNFHVKKNLDAQANVYKAARSSKIATKIGYDIVVEVTSIVT